MAALIKLRQMPVIQRCVWNHFNKVSTISRTISTSNKQDSETATATGTATATSEPEKKDWVSYGFDYESKEEDTNVHNASFFFSVTLCLVFGSFAWAYAPDVHMRDWSQREAFLELRRRENAGLRPIDPNFIDPSKIQLPSDEELEGVEIII